MDALERAASTSRAYVSEIRANVTIRQTFNNFFVSNASELYAHATLRREIRDQLTRVLKLNTIDSTTVYRGLLLQLNGVFELFIRQLVAAVLEKKAADVTVYSELDKALRDQHAIKSGAVLAQLADGEIQGVPYNFDRLQLHLGECFSDASPFHLNTDVLTLQMGNCTPKRLDHLFKVLGMAAAFDDETGADKGMRAWAGGGGARQTANAAREALENHIRIRNDLAHGSITRAVVATDVESAANFFQALIGALEAKARTIIGPAPI
jgi:hypothetical protein